ncbi:MAG: molecular chaperone DnaJ, partial [Oligoflexia bacterium]|nr:molecular chaperone DnaJ [Oligoflexia bacterium]
TNGGPAGDLYVNIRVKKHEFFERNGTDIICEVPLTFVEAAMGTEIEVPTLEGLVKMKIPAGTQSGRVFRLGGKGVFKLAGVVRGDELVRVVVEVPSKLSSEQKELLKKFDAATSLSSTPKNRDFREKLKRFFH